MCANIWAAEPAAAQPAAPSVLVLLWFDTEDYILPQSDDAALRLADWLTREKIRATFKVVGEKARTLERRKRVDVIEALKRHEIGFHSNWHSVPPSPAQYLSTLTWHEGVAEFDRRERPGFDDLTRIFGRAPSCYGQPGSSWGPQAYGAMRQWGMPVYLDYGKHLSLDGKPCRYCGVLNLFRLTHTLRTELETDAELDAAKLKFLESREQLLAEGGGVISIYYHPCEFVHAEFWDGVNFVGGASPARADWKLPPRKTPEQSAQAYRNFDGYIQTIHRQENVRFITALEAAELYRDVAVDRRFTTAELALIAKQTLKEISFQATADYELSAAEALCLLSHYVAAHTNTAVNETALNETEANETEANESATKARRAAAPGAKQLEIPLAYSPLGPSSAGPILNERTTASWSDFLLATNQVVESLDRNRATPSTVYFGSRGVSPEVYLDTVAQVSLRLMAGEERPAQVELRPATLAAAKYVTSDGPELWDWVIFPRGFHAPAMMELAKRQAWTLKPAAFRPSLKSPAGEQGK